MSNDAHAEPAPDQTDPMIDLMDEVEQAMGRDFRVRLSNAHCAELTEYEDRAVREHGRAILAMLDGTTFAPDEGSSYGRIVDSPLVRIVDGGPEGQ